jgi:hypothetical protein
MRNFQKTDGRAQIGHVSQDGRDAPVIGSEKRLDRQADEQLRLGEGPWAESMAVRRQGLFGDRQCDQRDLPWRLAGSAHPSLSTRRSPIAQVFIEQNIGEY